MPLRVKKTADGSSTIYHSDLEEHYHSIFGAVQEAMHVYINAGFMQLSDEQNRILEIGFGTGLNALLTCQAAERSRKKIIYHSLEKYPLPSKIIAQLNFGKAQQSRLQQIHQAPWDIPVQISPYFTLKKVTADLLTYQFQESYNLIYYDAFAPDKQAEMWTKPILSKVAHALLPNGIITTYSTKGTVKQIFRFLGMKVKRLKGPKGKKDMLYVHNTSNS